MWQRSPAGKSLGRTNLQRLSLSEDWQEFAGDCLVSPDAASIDFVVFSWRNSEAEFDIADFSIVND